MWPNDYHINMLVNTRQDPITDKGKASKKGRLTVQRAADTAKSSEEVWGSCGFVLNDESRSFCQDVYKPRQDENGTPGGEGFLHYTANGQYVTVASGRGDPEKDCEN